MKKTEQVLFLIYNFFPLQIIVFAWMFFSSSFILLDWIFPLKTTIRYSQSVLSKDSTLVHAFLSADDKWRFRISDSELNNAVKSAFLAKEDNFFYYHNGINPFSILRASFNNITKGHRTSGASTITMQVARLLEPKRRTYKNKIIEIFRAFQLETYYSKDNILKIYLDKVSYGANIEGIKAASLLYFNKPIEKLSLAELTALTIIPNRPTTLALGKNNELLKVERNKWLIRFKENKIFPFEEINDALKEPLTIKRHKLLLYCPHLANRLRKQLPNQELIYTHINRFLQEKAKTLAFNYTQKLLFYRIYNCSILIINNSTMGVEAYIGSHNFNDLAHEGQVDGVKAIRSPGSTLKPLLYGLCMDKGYITPKTVITDVPINLNGYTPLNFNEKFNGQVTAEEALAYSLNIPAVKLIDQYGVEAFCNVLKNCNFSQVEKDIHKLGLSTILGGCGASLEELTTLYAAFANNGRFKMNHLEKSSPDSINSMITSVEATYMLNEILTTMTRPDLPNNFESSYHIPKIAWKTGTSYGRRDAWSIGYNKKYTVGVWLGNFTGESVPELIGAELATPLLFEIFNSIDYNSTAEWYKRPSSLKFRLACPESGLIPSSFCTSSVADNFIEGVSPSGLCEHLMSVYVSKDEKISYCMDCLPSNSYKEKFYPNYPNDLLDWYQQENRSYDKQPIHNPLCKRIIEENAPKITSPSENKTYYIDSNTQELLLKSQVSNDVSWVYWYINDKFYKKAKPTERVFFKPTKAKIKISCSDDKGRNTDIRIKLAF